MNCDVRKGSQDNNLFKFVLQQENGFNLLKLLVLLTTIEIHISHTQLSIFLAKRKIPEWDLKPSSRQLGVFVDPLLKDLSWLRSSRSVLGSLQIHSCDCGTKEFFWFRRNFIQFRLIRGRRDSEVVRDTSSYPNLDLHFSPHPRTYSAMIEFDKLFR